MVINNKGSNMIKAHWLAACALIASLASFPLHAGEPAGMVKTSKGLVSIERDGKNLPAVVGTPVLVADKIRTGTDASVGVTLRDNTLLSAGPNSLIVIDKFVFDGTTQDGKMSIGIRKGTLSVATGKIAKRAPESVDFHTPTSVLGVRGTEFVIEVGAGSDE
jgi:hypothetical protein